MFCLNDTMRSHLCPGRMDMEGINSLNGVVREKMCSDVRNGDVFIFIGASHRLMKQLHAEDGGMVIEASRFKFSQYDAQSRSYTMEWRNLVVMVEDINEDPASRQHRLRAECTTYYV